MKKDDCLQTHRNFVFKSHFFTWKRSSIPMSHRVGMKGKLRKRENNTDWYQL